MGQDSRWRQDVLERGGTHRLKGPGSLVVVHSVGLFLDFVGMSEHAGWLLCVCHSFLPSQDRGQLPGPRGHLRGRRSRCQGHSAHCHCRQKPLASWPASPVRFGWGRPISELLPVSTVVPCPAESPACFYICSRYLEAPGSPRSSLCSCPHLWWRPLPSPPTLGLQPSTPTPGWPSPLCCPWWVSA